VERRNDEPRVGRRAALGIWASGLTSLGAACTGRDTTVIETPEGPVLQLERDELLVLVSGFKDSYRPGERVDLKVILNNQSRRFCQARIRTRLIGRGQQPIVEAEVVSVNVRPTDATPLDRTLQLPTTVTPGEYTLQVELPPWSFEGRQAGGGQLNRKVQIVA
jgi:hypothetical protein